MAVKPRKGSGALARPTLRDVARIAGVDPSLVSRVINDHPRASASVETRAKIFAAVKELDYRPSAVARGLRTARTSTIGLLLPDLKNPMYAEMVEGVESQARVRGYGVALGIHVDGGGTDASTLIQMLRHTQVDGLLVASALLNDDYLRSVQQYAYEPVVFLNRRVTGRVGSVVADDPAGARLAVEHLAELGHTRIAGVFGPQSIDTSVRRRKGFEKACRDLGVEAISQVIPDWTARDGYDATTELLTRRTPPTAVFGSSLTLAMGAMRAVRDAGLQVPEEVSVIGFDDHYIAEYLFPRLTTVAMPLAAMGAAAVDQLLAIIEGGAMRQVVIREAPRLCLRESTAPIKRARKVAVPR